MTVEELVQPERDEGVMAVLAVVGKLVKCLRERAGLTQAQLGDLIGYSESLVAAVEQGVRVPQPAFLDSADEVLDADGLLKSMKEDVEGAKYPAAVRNLARLEAKVTELSSYHALLVHGLLQTKDYARAVYMMRRPALDEDTIRQRVEARLERQAILCCKPMAEFDFVIEEAVLRRPIGGRAVLRGMLEKLLRIGRMRNVDIQVMPTDREDHAGLDGMFTLMGIPGRPKVAHTEGQKSSRLITDWKDVRAIEVRHGIIRAQALTPQESLTFIEKLLGEA